MVAAPFKTTPKCGCGTGTSLLARLDRGGRRYEGVLFRLLHQDLVGKRCLRTGLARRVMRQHDGHAYAEHALAQSNMPDAHVDVLALRLARLDHVAVRELHLLGARAANLATHGALHTFGAALHHEADDTIARAADRKATDEFEAQRLALRHCAKAAVGNLLCVQLHRILREVPALLHDRGELTDAAALLSKNILRAGRTDDHLGTHRRHADLDTRVAILSKLARQQLIQLRKEDAIRDELPLLADLSSHGTLQSTMPRHDLLRSGV
mmetsp:Transcript_12637/g.40697  ORF Transcript_12637/g.40697 Transcript_12637/m.40697 type:complete len:267 (+) Transcript_12637:389-1189(+)